MLHNKSIWVGQLGQLSVASMDKFSNVTHWHYCVFEKAPCSIFSSVVALLVIDEYCVNSIGNSEVDVNNNLFQCN